MQIYEAASTKTTTAAAQGIFTFVPPSTVRPDIREIGIFIAPTAAVGTIGIGRPANSPVGTTTVAGQATDPADPAAGCSIATAWTTTAPTAPTVFMRRLDLPATTGAGVIFTYAPNEFAAVNPAGIVVWQISATIATYDFYLRWEE